MQPETMQWETPEIETLAEGREAVINFLRAMTMRRHRAKWPEKNKENSLACQARVDARAPWYRAFHQAKHRAKVKGLQFTITIDWVVDMTPEYCPVLGLKLEKAVGYQKPNSPSLDRLDPNGGYTPDNVRVISWRANDLKKNATLEELEKLVAWMKIAA